MKGLGVDVERIEWRGEPLAYLVRASTKPDQTTFVTPDNFNFQLGFVVYPAGGDIVPHVHLPIERHIVGTSEVLFVREGRCEVDFYSPERDFVETKELVRGDVMLLLTGGHGFRMLEDTVLLEVKQGPYTGLREKDRFEHLDHQ